MSGMTVQDLCVQNDALTIGVKAVKTLLDYELHSNMYSMFGIVASNPNSNTEIKIIESDSLTEIN